MGNDFINTMRGQTIEELRVISFYLKMKCVCKIIVLYIKLDSGHWYKLTTSDGKNSIEMLEREPKELALNDIEDEFAYPVKTIQSKYVGKKIIEIKQYAWNNQSDSLSGFYMRLSDNLSFSLFEEDDCLEILDNVRKDDHYVLV